MAMMIPSDIGEFETEGEKAFYKFLEGVAKPDAHYLCWYLPEINGNEPDFLLYCEDVGLVRSPGDMLKSFRKRTSHRKMVIYKKLVQ